MAKIKFDNHVYNQAMNKNPLVNALLAFLYICLLVFVMTWGTKFIPGPDPVVMPVVMLSLFTFSAAVMGYLFCLQPLQLYLDGHKKSAIRLFVQTVGIFGSITLLMLVLLFSGLTS